VKKFLQKLFNPTQTDETIPTRGEVITAPLTPEHLEIVDRPTQPTAPLRSMQNTHIDPLQLIVGSGQSTGRQRDVNQDTIFTFSSSLGSNNSHVPFGLFIVADGMGGHQQGDVASEMAVRVVVDRIIRDLYIPLINPNQQTPAKSLQEVMLTGVMEAHSTILKKAPDSGTTLTAALILGRQMTIAHVGDSRAYLIDQNGQLNSLTRDHSLVRRLEEMGQITAAEAAVHPQRNVLYRALGQGEPFEPEIQSHRLPNTAQIMICSDGLWGVVPEDHMTSLINSKASPHEICQALVDMANEAGGPDNISVILVRMPG
jgi:PPM family protein phosphatase